MRDLDVMMQDVINMAFESVTPSVIVWVPLLYCFWSIGVTSSVRRVLAKKAADLYGMFYREISLVKKEFETYRKAPALRIDHPKYTASVLWVNGLKSRLVALYDVLHTASSSWLEGASREKDESLTTYAQVIASLDEYSSKIQSDWAKLVEDFNFSKKLSNNLLSRSSEISGVPTIECNIDNQLMKILAEYPYFEHSSLSVPDQTVVANSNVYVATRAHVVSFLRDYNTLLSSLNVTEKKLFRERLSGIDAVLIEGASNKTWADCTDVNSFLGECRRLLKDVSVLISEFKTHAKKIVDLCSSVSETELLQITKKRIYSESEFELSQRSRLNAALSEFKVTHSKITEILNKVRSRMF